MAPTTQATDLSQKQEMLEDWLPTDLSVALNRGPPPSRYTILEVLVAPPTLPPGPALTTGSGGPCSCSRALQCGPPVVWPSSGPAVRPGLRSNCLLWPAVQRTGPTQTLGPHNQLATQPPTRPDISRPHRHITPHKHRVTHTIPIPPHTAVGWK